MNKINAVPDFMYPLVFSGKATLCKLSESPEGEVQMQMESVIADQTRHTLKVIEGFSMEK